MDELISRQAAIDAIEQMQMPIMRSTFPEEQFVFKGMSEALSAIKELPSAQPEKRTQERTGTHACDLISRLSEIRSQYNCFNESEEPYYRALSEVIKKLSEQADGDTISRQAAIDAVTDELDMIDHVPQWVFDRLEKRLKQLPSAQPQRWIPCSERLPEDYEDVLVWFEYFRYGDYNRLYQTHGIGDYSSKYDSWMINHESGWSKLRVFAWMPLPEPYKEGNNG